MTFIRQKNVLLNNDKTNYELHRTLIKLIRDVKEIKQDLKKIKEEMNE